MLHLSRCLFRGLRLATDLYATVSSTLNISWVAFSCLVMRQLCVNPVNLSVYLHVFFIQYYEFIIWFTRKINYLTQSFGLVKGLQVSFESQISSLLDLWRHWTQVSIILMHLIGSDYSIKKFSSTNLHICIVSSKYNRAPFIISCRC
jgi:hypothetical protein